MNTPRPLASAAMLCALVSIVAWANPRISRAAAGKPFPVTIVDDHGNRVKIASRPSRIVSLDPRDTETLFAIGAESRVVGDGGQYVEGASGISRPFRFPAEWPSRWGRDYPVRSKQLTHVEGGCCGTDFNLETLASLRPDLIFAPYSQTELPTFGKMRDLGFKVVLLDPSSLTGVMHDITLVGTAVGNARQAKTVVGTIKGEEAAVRKAVRRTRSRPRTYYEVDATNPTQPYTVGPGTFIDEAIRLAGGKNVTGSVESAGCPSTLCYPRIDAEAVIRYNPQIIMLGDAAYGTTPDSVKSRNGWDVVSAVKTGKVYPFNDELISRAGPRIMIGLARMARLIHPEAFRKG